MGLGAPAEGPALIERMAQLAESDLREAYQIRGKQERTDANRRDFASRITQELVPEGSSADHAQTVANEFSNVEAKIVRNQILDGEPRIDGRDTRTVRPITIRTGVLPRAHGTALFTRGETQAMVTATLGTSRDEQIIDALQGEYRERFMMHYNLPPYSTGETGRVGSPKRREIGHGRLAKRALLAVLPSAEEFAYSLRVVSEITESNGSSSMASVCGGCLALMDAGVPLKAHVAGIAMGLIKEGNRFAVLTDILGDEDHLGDMDFKVAGHRTGRDRAADGHQDPGHHERDHARRARSGARRPHAHPRENEGGGRHPRAELSAYAPRMITMKIKPEKIRDVIGKGGAVIRAITEETGTTIDIQDDGTVTIACVSSEGGEAAKRRIEELTADVEVGKIYDGTVLKLLDFGAIVSVLPGRDGLLHISQIANERVNAVSDHLKEGQQVRVKVLEADEKGRLRLSMKAAAQEAQQQQQQAATAAGERGADGAVAGSAAQVAANRKAAASTAQHKRRGSRSCPFSFPRTIRPDYFATCRSLSSSSVLQSMHSVAVGRASRRFRPISTPHESQ